jgi:hypothetical protein
MADICMRWDIFWIYYNIRGTNQKQRRNVYYSGVHIFLNVFFTILHTSLTLVFIYYRYRSIAAKLVTLEISHCKESEKIFTLMSVNIRFIEDCFT